jgi:hypothetical protein
MFERSRVDNRIEPTGVPVEVDLIDGTLERGKLKVPANHAPLDALNAPGNFIEFEPYTGEARFIAKTTITGIRLVGVPGPPSLRPRGGASGDFDPHFVLGISTESSWEEIRQAYVRLSKTYHPDLYSTTTLPEEVATYIETMARRINAAYAAIEETGKQQRRPRGAVSAPVFTSSPRA